MEHEPGWTNGVVVLRDPVEHGYDLHPDWRENIALDSLADLVARQKKLSTANITYIKTDSAEA